MTLFKSLASVALAASAIAAATPASAVITTFASFSPIGTSANLYWKNNGPNGVNNGTGGSIYTIATGSSQVPGSRVVKFSFLQPSIAPYVTAVNALFTLNLTAPSGNPALIDASNILDQPGLTGGFSFKSVGTITIGTHVFASGSNLLTAVIGSAAPGDSADIFGKRGAQSGSLTGSTAASPSTSITYTSDFLNFALTADRAFSISLDSIISALQAVPSTGTPNRALRSFRTTASGTFSSDPAPIVTAVPEPAVWGLMVVGFGMVGLRVRRRSGNAAVSA